MKSQSVEVEKKIVLKTFPIEQLQFYTTALAGVMNFLYFKQDSIINRYHFHKFLKLNTVKINVKSRIGRTGKNYVYYVDLYGIVLGGIIKIFSYRQALNLQVFLNKASFHTD